MNNSTSDGRVAGGPADDPVACPDCDGSGTMLALFVRYAPGHSGPPVREMRCPFCSGDRTVPREKLAWRREGDRIRDYRREHQLTLRVASERWGLRPSEVSALEQGLAFNLDWRRRFGVESADGEAVPGQAQD